MPPDTTASIPYPLRTGGAGRTGGRTGGAAYILPFLPINFVGRTGTGGDFFNCDIDAVGREGGGGISANFSSTNLFPVAFETPHLSARRPQPLPVSFLIQPEGVSTVDTPIQTRSRKMTLFRTDKKCHFRRTRKQSGYQPLIPCRLPNAGLLLSRQSSTPLRTLGEVRPHGRGHYTYTTPRSRFPANVRPNVRPLARPDGQRAGQWRSRPRHPVHVRAGQAPIAACRVRAVRFG